MSVIYENSDGVIIDHKIALNQYYETVSEASDFQVQHNFKFKDDYFSSEAPFMMNFQAMKVGKLLEDNPLETVLPSLWAVKNKSTLQSKDEPKDIDLPSDIMHITKKLLAESGLYTAFLTAQMLKNNNKNIRDLVRIFLEKSPPTPSLKMNGGNNSRTSIITEISGEKYLFPNDCEFYNNDIKNLNLILRENKKYHCIVMDPPWFNKFIRRKNPKGQGYSFLFTDALCDMPIRELCAEGALIVVWCTNNANQLNEVENVLFPSWNVKYIGKWYWCKITNCGIPVSTFQLGKPHAKQPYEQILFGRMCSDVSSYNNPPDGRVIVSVPSAIHSHKPPLQDLIEPYFPSSAVNFLELFARSLNPGWCSYGNEVLKLQHISLFEKTEDICVGSDGLPSLDILKEL